MSSIPVAGPCSVCGSPNPSHRRCTVCYKPYCSKECQKADWKEHKKFCAPTHRGVSLVTDDDLERGVRKATHKLEMFNAQLLMHRIAHDAGPTFFIGSHPDLQRVMSRSWLDSMELWLPGAKAELLEGLADCTIKFEVTRIGGVQSIAVLNGKNTRLFLYLEDSNKKREWTVIVEPLADGVDEPF